MTHFPQQRRGRKQWRMRLRAAVALMILFPSIRVAQAHPWEQKVVEICVPMGVPRALALAFIDIESKGNPLAINVAVNGAHQGFLPQDRSRAHAILEDALRHTPQVAIGLLQISYRHHRAAMTPNPYRFFDAATNLAYGCQYLAQLLRQPGPLWQRIGRFYAASDLAKQQAYARRVLKRMMHHLRHQNGEVQQ
jgi:soluble lytic murein transglycosylase-like protein